jgi:hypothetical protein
MQKKYALYKCPLIFSNNSQDGGKKKKSKQTRLTSYNTVQDINKTINKDYFRQIEFPQLCWEYPYTPAILPAQPRIIVMGDIHGDYKLAIKMLLLSGTIQIVGNKITWIGGNTYIVQVGDQVDRCRPIGNMTCDKKTTTYDDEASDLKILRLFTDLDKQAITVGGRVISLFGNHELMNAEGIMDYVSYEGINEFSDYKDPKNPALTFKSPLEARKYAFSPTNEIGKLLGCTRLPAVIIGSNLFVHAGIINSIIDFLQIHEESDLETINIAVRKWLLGLVNKDYIGRIISSSNNSMFWTRILGNLPPGVNIYDKRCVDSISKVLKLFKIGHIFVGHTPQSFTYSQHINSTCGDTVWRVDNGSSAAFHKFDFNFLNTGIVEDSRKPQVLEILNDSIYKIIM